MPKRLATAGCRSDVRYGDSLWCRWPRAPGVGVEPEIDAVCRMAAEHLERDGAPVEQIAFGAADSIDAYKAVRDQWMVVRPLERIDPVERFGPNLATNVRYGLALEPRNLAKAEHRREAVWRKFRALLDRYDYLLTPAAPVSPLMPVSVLVVVTIASPGCSPRRSCLI